jgi:hypothetical protein
MRPSRGRLSAPCTRSGVIYGRDQQNSSRIATIWSRICPRDTFLSVDSLFQKNCFRKNWFFGEISFLGEFGDEKKFASFSPEFLVLTRTSPAVSTHRSDMTTGRLLRRRFLKKEAFVGANSAGSRDEL